jgi:signal transduction histidine kinase
MGKNIGQLQIQIVIAVILFIVFFFIITKRSIDYIEEISIVLGHISRGNLDSKIAVRSSDEFSKLAQDINLMTQRLKKSIEDERNAERTKNELITSVSHDLRTPLTSIVGYLGLIVNDSYKSEEEFHYYADIAYQKSLKLSNLIDDLFDFTQLNYGGIRIKPDELNLADFVNQLAEEFFPILEDAGMEYKLSMPEDKVMVMADGDLLARVFDNLLTNAVRYGREGKYIDILLEKSNGKAVIKVANYGKCIPEKDLPFIFEKFYRVEQSRSDKTGGTGLGLAIAKNIIELHNGTIKAYSGNGETIFELSLPLLSVT